LVAGRLDAGPEGLGSLWAGVADVAGKRQKCHVEAMSTITAEIIELGRHVLQHLVKRAPVDADILRKTGVPSGTASGHAYRLAAGISELRNFAPPLVD